FQNVNLPIAFAYKDAEATVEVGQGSSITSTGTVSLQSKAETDDEGKAKYSGSSSVGLAFAVAIGIPSAQTLTDPGAKITAAGTNRSNNSASSASYHDGKVGITFAVNVSKANVTTTVDGTVTAGAPSSTTGTATLNPFTGVSGNVITFATNPGFHTGDAV